MLSANRSIAGDLFIFGTVLVKPCLSLLERTIPKFIGPNLCPLNSPDLNPVDYKILGAFYRNVL